MNRQQRRAGQRARPGGGMASQNGVHANGYGTLDQLRSLKRTEWDFKKWDAMTLRLQELGDPELRRVREYVGAVDGASDEERSERDRLASIAFALVKPDLRPFDDLDAAVEAVEHIPIAIQRMLSAAIVQSLWIDPKAVARSFFENPDSPPTEAATDSTSSDSPKSPAMSTPA